MDMKFKLSLTTEEGELLEQWVIEDEIGDLNNPLPRIHLAEAILREMAIHKSIVGGEFKPPRHRKP